MPIENMKKKIRKESKYVTKKKKINKTQRKRSRGKEGEKSYKTGRKQ